jgi:hypothetical protein
MRGIVKNDTAVLKSIANDASSGRILNKVAIITVFAAIGTIA